MKPAFGRLAPAIALAVALLSSTLFAPSDAHAEPFRLATWNIGWLTDRPKDDPGVPKSVKYRRTEADYALLRSYLARMAPDVVALQEIDGEGPARRLFPAAEWDLFLTDETDTQRPALAVRKGRGVATQRNPDLAELDVTANEPRSLRRGLDVTLTGANWSLRLLVVHLKCCCPTEPATASNDNCPPLWRQLPVLERWIAARAAESKPYALAGDFNRKFSQTDSFYQSLRAAAKRQITDLGYWLKSPCWTHTGEPMIDHLMLGGPAERWHDGKSLYVMTYDEPKTEDNIARLSDHCAVYATIQPKP